MSKAYFSRPIQYEDALVTSLVRYGDSDCILRLFFKHTGRASGFYKRGLKSTKKKQGVITAPSFARIGYIHSTNENLLRIISADIDVSHYSFNNSLHNIGYLFYLAELIECFLMEGENAFDLYVLISKAFKEIMKQGANPALLRAFELKLLHYSGYLPAFPNGEHKQFFFDPHSSTFVPHETSGIKVSKKAIELANEFINKDLGTVYSCDKEELLLLGKLFQIRLRMLVKKPLGSIKFLKTLKKVSKD